MITSSERIGNGLARVTVELSVAELNKEYGRAAKRISSRTRIPGFRPGNAPIGIVENMFGKPAIISEAVEKIVPDSYADALVAEELVAIDQPEINFEDEEEMSFESPVVFTATVPLRPTVELGDAGTITLEEEPVEVGDEDVAATLQQLQESRAQTVPVEGRALQDGDLAGAVIKMLVDDVNQLGDAQISVAVGGNGFPEGFDEQVIGMETGDVREFELPFEVDHPDETMRGKDAQFRVELHVVNEREIPEVDDAFAAEVSGFDTVKELEDDIRERLLEERKTAARRELEGSALGLLADRSSFEIPEVLVHQQAHALMEDQTRRLTTQGMALDSYLGSIGSSQDEFHDQAMEEAERRIGQALMLDVLADRYGIEVTEEDVEAELAQLLERFPEPDRASMRDMYLGDGGQERMELGLRERKAMESLMDSVVTSSEEPAAPAQPEEADEASEAAEASAETEEDNDQGTG